MAPDADSIERLLHKLVGEVTPEERAELVSAWLTVDRCDGTLTTVRRGRVAVRDLRRRRTIVVRAGGRYLARAQR